MMLHYIKRYLIPRPLALLALLMVIGYAAPALAEKRYVMGVPEVAPGSVPIAGEYWALIIGIDKYTHAPPLETAVKDATGVRDVLLTRYGFKRERIIELLDEQATRIGIEEALYTLSRQAGAEDSVFIYYAGHGQYDQDGRLGWWVPVEGKPQSPGTFITNASIRDYIEGMQAKHIYLVADSCFSGTLFGRTRAMPPLNDQFFAKLYASRSRWGLTSGGTEPVADRGKAGHSIFAYHFIKLLQENADPYLVPSHIFDQIAPIIANNSEQTPRSEPLKGAGDEGGQFVFRLTAGLVKVTPSASGVGREHQASAPSAAVNQAEQRLKALEEEERKVEEQQKLAELQAQIAAKKQQIEEKKQQPVMASIPSPSLHEQPREIRGKDGAPMPLIPAGEFMMGSTDGDADEKPVHKVSLDAFYLDKYEVTNRLFQMFVQETGYKTTAEREGNAVAIVLDKGFFKDSWEAKYVSGAHWRKPEGGATVFDSNREEHPVVSVSWHDADAYCRWAGKRLPTEAEFEYALRAGTTTTFWWGNGDPGRRVANIRDESAKREFGVTSMVEGYDDGYARTAPVGSFEPNPWGLHDLIGNVREWAADWYASDFYQHGSGHNPTGPSNGQFRVIRSGSWWDGPGALRSADRGSWGPMNRDMGIGFRCAKDAR